MKTARRIGIPLLSIAVVVAVLAGVPAGVGAAQELQPVTIGFSGSGVNFLPAVIAEAEGFTAKHGLDVTHVFLSGGTPTVQAMVAGEFPIAIESITMMHAHLQGFDPVVIASFIPHLPFHFVTRGDIMTADDLRGGRAAISTPGAVSDGAARLAITRLGLTPELDVALVPIGGQTARLAAMEAKTVDAAILSPPLSYELTGQGYRILVDLMAERLPLNHENVITTKQVIQEHPDLLKKYVKAIGEALHYIHTEPEGTMGHIADWLELDLEAQRAIIERTYKEYVQYNIPRKPYPLVTGWRNALELGSLQNPDVLSLDPWDLMDVRFVRELDEEGFFDALYEQ